MNYFIISIIILIIFIIINIYLQTKFNKKYKLLSGFKFFYIKNILLLLSFIFVGFSYFGESQKENYNSDYIFTIDISKSMLVKDVDYKGTKISRLDATKKIISDNVNKLNGKFGIVIFSYEGRGLLPLTGDKDMFFTFLNGINTDNLKGNGTNYNSILGVVSNRLIDSGNKNIVIFTDGGDDGDFDINKSNNFKEIYDNILKEGKNNYFIYGIGSKNGGKIIDGYDIFGNVTYIKSNGKDVVLPLNINNIDNIVKILDAKKVFIDNLSKFNNILTENTNTIQNYLYNINNKFIISFIFFLLFLILYIYENYYLTQKIGRK